MRRIISFVLISVFIINFSLFAEVTSYPEIGSVQNFYSADKKFSVEVKVLGNVDKDPAGCTFKQGKKIIWQKKIPATPGKAAISNNGKYIAFLNWGLYDEMWFKSLYIYDDKGELLKEDKFGVDKGIVSVEISGTGTCIIKDWDNKEYKYEVGQ